MKRYQKIGAAMAALAIAATAVPAVAQDEASAEDVVVYGLYKRMDQGWFQNEAAGAEARGEELGIEVVTLDNQFDPNVMSANLDNAITEGASGILMVVPDQQLGAGVIEKARAAGIPLIAIDDSITDANGDPAPFVGMNTAQIGTDVGTMLAGFANDREWFDPEDASSLKVAALTFSTLDVCNQRTDASKAAILEGLPGLSEDAIIEVDYEGANTDGGLLAMQGLLTANPDAQHWLVYSCNEEGVVGAVRALEAAGKDADACGVGLGDGALAKIEMIEKGSPGYCGSLYVDSRKHGAVGVQAIYDYVVNGTEIPLEQLQDGIQVTAENAAEVFGS